MQHTYAKAEGGHHEGPTPSFRLEQTVTVTTEFFGGDTAGQIGHAMNRVMLCRPWFNANTSCKSWLRYLDAESPPTIASVCVGAVGWGVVCITTGAALSLASSIASLCTSRDSSPAGALFSCFIIVSNQIDGDDCVSKGVNGSSESGWISCDK